MEIRVRRRLLAYVTALVLFGAGGLIFGLAALLGRDFATGLLAICCGLLAALAAANLRPIRPWLIGDQTITLRTAIGSERYNWKDVTSFRAGPPIALIAESISFDLVAGHEGGAVQGVVTKMTRALVGADRNWPNVTVMDTDELVQLLNKRRRQAAGPL